jgi:hypothetical protein
LAVTGWKRDPERSASLMRGVPGVSTLLLLVNMSTSIVYRVFDGTARHLEALIQSGIAGIIMLGSLGENQSLEHQSPACAGAGRAETEPAPGGGHVRDHRAFHPPGCPLIGDRRGDRPGGDVPRRG